MAACMTRGGLQACTPSCRLPRPLPAAQVASQQGAYVAHLINRRYRVGKGGMSTDPPTKPARGMEWIDRVTGSVDLDDAEQVGAAVGNPNPWITRRTLAVNKGKQAGAPVCRAGGAGSRRRPGAARASAHACAGSFSGNYCRAVFPCACSYLRHPLAPRPTPCARPNPCNPTPFPAPLRARPPCANSHCVPTRPPAAGGVLQEAL